jgi:hypothetical protein
VPLAWFDYMMRDPLYVNAALLTSGRVYAALYAGGDDTAAAAMLQLPGARNLIAATQAHHCKTLRLLQERLHSLALAEKGSKTLHTLADSTIASIIVVLTFALAQADVAAAQAHMCGIQRIQDLRGGVASLAANIPLRYNLNLADIGVALMSGEPLLFGADYFHWSSPPVTPSEVLGVSPSFNPVSDTFAFLGAVNGDLAGAMYELVCLAGLGQAMVDDKDDALDFKPVVFQEVLVGTMFSILNLRAEDEEQRGRVREDERESVYDNEEEKLERKRRRQQRLNWWEAVRLGMLVYSVNSFLQPEKVPFPYHRVRWQLQAALLQLDDLADPKTLSTASSGMMAVATWLIIVAFSPSPFADGSDDGGVDGQMLFEIGRDVFDTAHLERWDECKSLLEDLPGMHVSYEARARLAFEHIASASFIG